MGSNLLTINKSRHLRPQPRQIGMYGLTHPLQIDLAVAVCASIAHFVSNIHWTLGVLIRDLRVVSTNVVGCFANDCEISDHRILGFLIQQKD